MLQICEWVVFRGVPGINTVVCAVCENTPYVFVPCHDIFHRPNLTKQASCYLGSPALWVAWVAMGCSGPRAIVLGTAEL